MDNDKLASELLREVKSSARRWFIAFCIMVGLEIFTVAGFMWYITLPVEESSIEQSVEDVDNSNISQQIGVDNNGESVSESDLQTESSQNEK